ncbi:MAG: signal peptidase II [Actinomycetales bacterium]|nr:signal peptidase II [Actinomycetales bacterium]
MQGEGGARLSAIPTPAPPSSARRRALTLTFIAVAIITYAADQATKVWALAMLSDERARELLGTVIQLRLVRNPGAAFSLGTGSTWVLTLLAVVVLVAIVRTSRRLGSRAWAWALGLVLGGALGNLTDRLVREPSVGQGHVIDFIDYGWFIGNVADIAIVAAAALIGLLALRGIGIDGSRDG